MELLDDIRRVESEGERLISKAKQQADELIRDARERAQKLIEAVKAEGRETESKVVAEAEAKAQSDTQRSRKESLHGLESLRTSAQKNMDGAIKLIIDRIAGNP